MSTTAFPAILVVEDSDADYLALTRAFKRIGLQNPVRRCTDGDEALEFLRLSTTLPSHEQPILMLLDLNMPGTDGRTVLEAVKQDPRLRSMPVVVLSTSSNPRDVHDCYQLGVNAYMVKPIDFQHLEARVRLLTQYWLDAATLPTKAA